MFHKLFRFFFHQPIGLRRRPRQYVNEFDIREVAEDEQLLMRAIKARSPQNAQVLIAKYKAANIYELLVKLQSRKPSLWNRFKSRLALLVMRMEGATWQNPAKVRRKDDMRMDVDYDWMEE